MTLGVFPILVIFSLGVRSALTIETNPSSQPNDTLSSGASHFNDPNNQDFVVTRTDAAISFCDRVGSACVPYYACERGNIITDGQGLIDIRVEGFSYPRHSNCIRYFEVCCAKPPDTIVRPPHEDSPVQSTCGHRNENGVLASIDGFNVTETQFGEFPWMVAILRTELIGSEEANLYLCGGSLIEPNVILTAAHCVDDYHYGKMKVRAGEWDTQSVDNNRAYEPLPHQDRLVEHLIIHPGFNNQSLFNDFAILILKTPFDLKPNVGTICLPEATANFDFNNCIATGWGKDKFGKVGRYQNVLKKVLLRVRPHKVCEDTLQRTRLGQYFRLHDSFLCAGGEPGVDTCKGDGGSPLVCDLYVGNQQTSLYYQAGIVAWGIGCGEKTIPGVYASVSKGVDWMRQTYQPYLLN